MKPEAALETPSIAEQIRKTVGSGELALPPLPEIVLRLQEMLRDENADARSLSKLLSNEPALTASVLKVANSAVYGGLSGVSTPQDAVARLGMRQVGVTITAAAHKGHFTSSNPERAELLKVLWRHSIATAIGARALAEQADGNTTDAYLAGLLHDVGKLVVLKGLDQIEAQRGAPFTAPVTDELIQMLHAPLGGTVLARWKIARPICEIARQHHDEPQDANDNLLIQVQAANLLSKKLGAHPHPTPDVDLMIRPEIERLMMSELEVAALAVEIEDELARIMAAL